MDAATREQLLALNRSFYEALAVPFRRTRARPQPGFERLLAHLPVPCWSALDIGCGEGRFGRFLKDRCDLERYVGVDFSPALLHFAEKGISGDFFERDLAAHGALADLGQFDLVVALAVLQHIPGRTQRARLLREMGEHLEPHGRIFLSTWQFLDSPRQQRKVVDWSVVDIVPEKVEENDFLLTWQSGGFALRYVAYIGPDELAHLVQQAGLKIQQQFRSDGKEGDLNLYAVLEPS